MNKKGTVVFDIIGTCFSLDKPRQRLVELGAPSYALELWFAQSLRDAFALSLLFTASLLRGKREKVKGKRDGRNCHSSSFPLEPFPTLRKRENDIPILSPFPLHLFPIEDLELSVKSQDCRGWVIDVCYGVWNDTTPHFRSLY